VNGFLNYTGSYYNVSVSPFQRVKPNKTVDLTAAYEFKDVGISYLKGVTLQARVANVFDKNPPFYDSANGYDGNQASPFPRSYDLTVRAKF
jgi:iron complex outermembrane receptor protein